MAFTLKSRDRQVPNGFKFTQPETGWQAPKQGSFSVIVNALINHRRANPHLVQQQKWSLDYEQVANEVDFFNARLCAAHGWNDYINDGSQDHAPPPKSQALLQSEKKRDRCCGG